LILAYMAMTGSAGNAPHLVNARRETQNASGEIACQAVKVAPAETLLLETWRHSALKCLIKHRRRKIVANRSFGEFSD